MAWHRYRCRNGHVWDVPLEIMAGGPPELCPTCNTANIAATQPINIGYGKRRRKHTLRNQLQVKEL